VDERDQMEKFYKNHRIEVSLSLEDEGWFVNLFIYYNEKDTNILMIFVGQEVCNLRWSSRSRSFSGSRVD